MKIACLCPTYGRPRMVRNALACFLAQDYPAHLCRLLILDDAGQIRPQSGVNWEVHSTAVRYPSLPAKYSDLVRLAADWGADAIAEWDDDDVYLPWHLSAVAAGLQEAPWYYPAAVLSDGGGQLQIERPQGNLIACHAVRLDFLLSLGGWPKTHRADFDLVHLARMRALAEPCRDLLPQGPSYAFRWASTGHTHYQNHAADPAGDAYSRASLDDGSPVCVLHPEFDANAATILSLLQASMPSASNVSQKCV